MKAFSVRFTRLIVAAGLLLMSAGGAWAHVEPTGCSGNFVTMGIRVFRADGVTPIAGGGTVSPCETIQYEVTVAYPPGQNFCAFEDGKIFITTPDGVTTEVTPVGGVPCLGGDDPLPTDPCPLGQNTVLSLRKSYTVRPQDIIANTINATGNYGQTPCAANPGSCGTAHTTANEVFNVVSGSQGNGIDVTPCGENPICQRTFCDPQATDGVRTGFCVTENLPNSTNQDARCTDTDGTLCTTPGCAAGSASGPRDAVVPTRIPATPSHTNPASAMHHTALPDSLNASCATTARSPPPAAPRGLRQPVTRSCPTDAILRHRVRSPASGPILPPALPDSLNASCADTDGTLCTTPAAPRGSASGPRERGRAQPTRIPATPSPATRPPASHPHRPARQPQCVVPIPTARSVPPRLRREGASGPRDAVVPSSDPATPSPAPASGPMHPPPCDDLNASCAIPTARSVPPRLRRGVCVRPVTQSCPRT
jgi:hypothetical protein